MGASFHYEPVFGPQKDETRYRLLSRGHVSAASFEGKKILKVAPEALVLLAKEALKEVSFYLRTAHLEKLALILADPEASDNDRFVAAALLKNAVISAKGEL